MTHHSCKDKFLLLLLQEEDHVRQQHSVDVCRERAAAQHRLLDHTPVLNVHLGNMFTLPGKKYNLLLPRGRCFIIAFTEADDSWHDNTPGNVNSAASCHHKEPRNQRQARTDLRILIQSCFWLGLCTCENTYISVYIHINICEHVRACKHKRT